MSVCVRERERERDGEKSTAISEERSVRKKTGGEG
jgi:hypothetical protein